MLDIVTDAVEWSVRRSVGHDHEPCKTAQPIDMPFGLWTRVRQRKHVLGGGARWRQLANTTEPSVCGGDAVYRQITLTTCFFFMISLWFR